MGELYSTLNMYILQRSPPWSSRVKPFVVEHSSESVALYSRSYCISDLIVLVLITLQTIRLAAYSETLGGCPDWGRRKVEPVNCDSICRNWYVYLAANLYLNYCAAAHLFFNVQWEIFRTGQWYLVTTDPTTWRKAGILEGYFIQEVIDHTFCIQKVS